jgi:hypothetical protein
MNDFKMITNAKNCFSNPSRLTGPLSGIPDIYNLYPSVVAVSPNSCWVLAPVLAINAGEEEEQEEVNYYSSNRVNCY